MPKAKQIVKDWKPKLNKQLKSTAKNKHSQQFGVVGKFGTGWKPYIRPYFGVADFDLGKCMSLEIHEDAKYLKKLTSKDPTDETRTYSFSAFGAVLESTFVKKKVDDKETRKYREVSFTKLPPALADLFIQTDMRDIRWGTSASAVGAIETEKDLDKARFLAIRLLLDHKLIRLQEEDYDLAEKLGLQAKVISALDEIEI